MDAWIHSYLLCKICIYLFFVPLLLPLSADLSYFTLIAPPAVCCWFWNTSHEAMYGTKLCDANALNVTWPRVGCLFILYLNSFLVLLLVVTFLNSSSAFIYFLPFREKWCKRSEKYWNFTNSTQKDGSFKSQNIRKYQQRHGTQAQTYTKNFY